MNSPLINNSRSIIRGWIKRSDDRKYDEAYRQMVAEWTGIEPADSRDGSDTGMEPETNQD